jgi:hypothetical protein
MALTLNSFISRLTNAETPRGPSPAFSSAHILKVLLVLDTEQTMGRITLSKRIGIGEGSIRTIIKKLVDFSVISVDAVGGCHLTELGKSIVRELRCIIVASTPIVLDEVGILFPSYALQLRGVSISSSSLTRLRDKSVKSGAEGLMIFVFEGDRITLPMMTEDVSTLYPRTTAALKSAFQLEEGDSILIAFSEEVNLAELGALSAALSIISA